MELNNKKDIKVDKSNKKKQSQTIFEPQRQFQFLHIPTTNIKHENQKNKHHNQAQFMDQYSKVKTAKQWWDNIDIVYFKQTKHKNILLSKDLLSGQKLINFFSDQSEFQNSYIDQQIVSTNTKLRQDTLIHVLFKSHKPFFMSLISYSFSNYIQNFNRRLNKLQTQSQCISKQKQFLPFIVTSQVKFKRQQGLMGISQQQTIQQAIKIGTLQFIAGNLQFENKMTNENILSKIQKVHSIKNKNLFHQQIDYQIQFWRAEQQKQNSQNSISWNNIIKKYLQQKQLNAIKQNFDQEIVNIKQSVMNHTILKYFQLGTKDKTQEMLDSLILSLKQIKPVKSRNNPSKKFFQTDCKICFCSYNYQSNQVLYCDQCNTSFHLACYGLENLPKSQQYYCDCCAAIKKQQNQKQCQLKKITCQICCKAKFPLKQIDGHFYHMTCLVIFNFVTIKNRKVQFREGLNHQSIIKKVIQSQIQCENCIFCQRKKGAQTGMQFKCSFPGCNSSMHPICAYINGCEFRVFKNVKEKKIDTNILCKKHDQKRDYVHQTYLRRYMCNFKKTSEKTKQLFQTDYINENQQSKQKSSLKMCETEVFPSLIINSKIIRKHMIQRQQKKMQKNQETECTQTRRMLERLTRQNN